MVDTANSGQINQSFASNLADVFEGVFGLIGTLANVMNLVPDLVKKSSVNLIPNPSVLKQLGKLNMTEVNKTIQSVKQSESERELEKSSKSSNLCPKNSDEKYF